MTEPIAIRKAVTPDDYRACQEAQRRAWSLVDDSYIIPIATMVGAQHHGGLVLGAFLADGTAAGVSFAFLGKLDGRPVLYSQLTGVVPGQQGTGLGFRLKEAQREYARAEGLAALAWSFDPLQAGNARFNLAKLGARAIRYVDDMYGPRTDALNAGVPTDRLIAEWSVDRLPRNPIVAPNSLPRLIQSGDEPDAVEVVPDAPALLLEIPEDIARIRASNSEAAERWRIAVGRAFKSAFAAGYRADDFVREDQIQGYVLRRPGGGLVADGSGDRHGNGSGNVASAR